MSNEMKDISWPGWKTVRLIGQGGFGAVYEIQRSVFGDTEKAALKIITIPQNQGDIEEFYNDGYDEESVASILQGHLQSVVKEYTMMRQMNGCANIVNCDDVEYIQHEDGIGWDILIKMELLTPLPKALPSTISDDLVVKVAKDMCAALELCKKYGIIHRDIKPQNIFVSKNGDYKLGDFGIAKTVEKTTGGTKIGTYKYMAPEVYHNQPYGVSADIYSLGLVLYWMLNKRRMPFTPAHSEKTTASIDTEARRRRLAGEVIPPPANGSERLKRIVLKACAYDPKERYHTAGEMLRDLNELSGDVVVIPPEDDPDPTVGVFGNSPHTDEVTEENNQTVFVEKKTEYILEVEKDSGSVSENESTELEQTSRKTPQQTLDNKTANRKKLPVIIGIAVTILIIIFLLMRGCNPSDPVSSEPVATGNPTETIGEVYTPELNTDRLALFQDRTAVLTVSGVPEDAKIKWKSDDKSVAKVSNEGLVTAVGEGVTIITATWKYEGETYEMTAEVTVTASGVTLNEYTINDFYIGETRTLTATTSPEGEKVVWESSDEKVITVNADGVVTAVGSGDATITVSFGTYSETCKITVTKPGVTLSKTKFNLYAGDSTTISVKTDPAGATVTWSSDNSSVAAVSNGKIQAVGAGSTTVRAKITHAGKEYEEVCTVTVITPSVSMSNGSISILPGESKTLSASSKPEGLSVSWSSSNSSVATVSEGKVTAVAPGSATITVQVTYKDKTYKSTCSVTVNTPSVSLNNGSLSLYPGESKTLSASTNTGSSVSWSSSNTSVVTVSGGTVKAVAPGSATITAQITHAGQNYKATCSVTVYEPTISVTSSASTITYAEREQDRQTCTVTAEVKPDGGNVTWSSSDTAVATVSGNGTTATVKAVSSGSATITATYTVSGRTISDSCTVNVSKASSTLKVTNVSYPSRSTLEDFYFDVRVSSNYQITKLEVVGKSRSVATGLTASNSDTFTFASGTYETGSAEAAAITGFLRDRYRALYNIYGFGAGIFGADKSLEITVYSTFYDSSGASYNFTINYVLEG